MDDKFLSLPNHFICVSCRVVKLLNMEKERNCFDKLICLNSSE